MKAFFAALLVLLASLQLAASQCNGNGEQLNGACACYSGFSDESCSSDASSSSCVFPTVAPLATQVVAEFMAGQSSIVNDNFTFVIESPATSGRYFSSISLNGNENCSYPGPNYVKTFRADPDCKDVFTGLFTIPEVVDVCGFTETVGATETTLSGSVSLSAVDPIGTFRGHTITRTTTSHLALDLKLPTFVNMTTSELEIYSPISTMAAVTRQEYDFEADTATIEVTVSVQWPYTFTASSGSNPNPLSLYSSSIADIECANVTGENCLQVITYTIANIRSGARVCNFDGSYSLTLTYNCRSAQNPCPVSGQDTVEVAFNLTSGDICASVSIQASILGEIKSYTDNSFTTERLVIVAGQRIFLRASVTADVTIQNLVIKAIRVVQGGVPVTVVVNDAAAAPYDPAISYQPLEGTVADNQRGVSFLATYGTNPDSLFDSSVADGVFAFTIEIDLEVVYRTTFISKRDVSSSMLTMSAQGVMIAPKL